MSGRRRRAILSLVVVSYFLGVGFIGGVLAERVRFDRRRAQVLVRFDSSARALHKQLIQLEQRSRAVAGATAEITEER